MTTLTIKEMPVTERPYEKCELYGASALSDAELLAVIIKSGIPGERSTDLANRILTADKNGLLNIVYMPIDQLQKIKGIGKVKAIQLKCVAELSKRLSERKRMTNVCLSDPESVATYYMERLRHEEKEHLLMSMFNVKSELIGDTVVTIGTTNASLISVSEVYRTALRFNAHSIVLLHNHPSGNPSPSREDISITDRLYKAGEMIGIHLVDHIIIGNKDYYSFCRNGLIG